MYLNGIRYIVVRPKDEDKLGSRSMRRGYEQEEAWEIVFVMGRGSWASPLLDEGHMVLMTAFLGVGCIARRHGSSPQSWKGSRRGAATRDPEAGYAR